MPFLDKYTIFKYTYTHNNYIIKNIIIKDCFVENVKVQNTIPNIVYTQDNNDVQSVEELKNIRLKFRGSENQRVIDVPKTLQKGECILYLGEK
mgnify:CR=1 FL=1